MAYLSKTEFRRRYSQAMNSDHWQRIRAARLRIAEQQCEYTDHDGRCDACSTWSELHCHHKTYDRLGNERVEDVVILCPQHHLITHLLEHTCNNCREEIYYCADDVWLDHDVDQLIEDYDFKEALEIARVDTPNFCSHCSWD